MSADARAGEREGDDVGTADYDQMLADLDVAIGEARRKIDEGRVRDPEREKVRIKWVRALAYLINIRRQVCNDRDLEALADEIEDLKDGRGTEV
jgi:hypothetical protein